jgi:hypothetical protein
MGSFQVNPQKIVLYRLAIELSLKIVSLFKDFQLSIGINHSNFKLRLRLSLKNNWYYRLFGLVITTSFTQAPGDNSSSQRMVLNKSSG